MVEKIVEFYQAKGLKFVVVSSDVQQIISFLPEKLKSGLTIEIIDDVRSATFFANGAANRLNTPVLLIVGYKFLANCYTGLTEAWFQQLKVITVALAETSEIVNYAYLRPCIRAGITIDSADLNAHQKVLEDSLVAFGPTLLCVRYDHPPIRTMGYQSILDELNKVLSSKDTVFYYGGLNNDTGYVFKLKTIQDKHKYGVISKYVGYSYASGCNSYLVIPLELLKYDTNIFSTRYITQSLKILFISDNDSKLPIAWFEKNSLDCKVVDYLDQSILSQFISSSNPSALVWKIDGGVN